MLLYLRPAFLLLTALAFSGCQNASLDSYVDPSYSAKEIHKVVVLPMTNASITPGQAQELARAFAQGMQRTNPGLEVMGAGEAIDKINAANMADEWATFLRNYNTSGIPNTNTIKRVGKALGVDAIVQGSILNVSQKDSNGYDYPMTRVTVRYGAINAKTGVLLWEISSEGTIQPYSYTAAPIIDAIRLAHAKILESIPR
jgi:TolB-like protein